MEAKSVEDYIAAIDDGKKEMFLQIRKTIRENIADGFVEAPHYGMVGYIAPLEKFPAGYLNRKNEPLPFIDIAAQKSYVSFYYFPLYLDEKLTSWFIDEYKNKKYPHKIDVGKSCVRFKYQDEIPYDLLGTLVRAFTLEEWIEQYKKQLEDNDSKTTAKKT
jgi:uncharacterized protein YdhG (YjbR/CyaY superfamily)